MLLQSTQLLAREDSLTLVYTGRLEGEIEPCGCSEGSDLGGIRRLAEAIDQFRRLDPDLVLVGSGGVLGTLLPAHRISNAFILSGLAQLDYDAIGVQWSDLVYGPEFIIGPNLPWVASNWRSGRFSKVRHIDRGRLQLAYLQWLAPEQSPYRNLPDNQKQTHADMAILRQQLQQLKQQGIITILGTYGMPTPLAQLPTEHIDIVLIADKNEHFKLPRRIGTTWVLGPGSRGQHVARLRLQRQKDDHWNDVSHKVIALDESIVDAARLQPWYEHYTEALKADYRSRKQRAERLKATTPYAGVSACADCHKAQFTQWQSTAHSHALRSLLRVSKGFDANCLVCHTTGFDRPGGFITRLSKPDLADVACEACHGPARQHAQSGGSANLAPVTMQTCKQCHTRERSPAFNLSAYWPLVAH